MCFLPKLDARIVLFARFFIISRKVTNLSSPIEFETHSCIKVIILMHVSLNPNYYFDQF